MFTSARQHSPNLIAQNKQKKHILPSRVGSEYEELLCVLRLCEEGVDHLFVRMFSIYFGMFSELLVRNDLRLWAEHTLHILPHTKCMTLGFPYSVGHQNPFDQNPFQKTFEQL